MMKRLLFMFLLVVAATATITAQDDPDEQTAAPNINLTLEECYCVYIENSFLDPDATIYYRYARYDDSYGDFDWSEWMEYLTPLYIFDAGDYMVESYAAAPGKLVSEHVTISFHYDGQSWPHPSPPDVYCNYSYEDWGYNDYWAFANLQIINNEPDAIVFYRITVYQRYSDNDEWYNTYMTNDDWEYFGGDSWDFGFYVNADDDTKIVVETYARLNDQYDGEMVVEEYFIPSYDPHKINNSDFSVDGIYYRILNNSTVAVTTQYIDAYGSFSWVGDVLCHYGKDYICYSGVVNIPSTVEYNGRTYTVTTINKGAFWNSDVTRVTIPNTVTTIGDYAFAKSGLTSVTLPESVTQIGVGAFANCANLASANVPSSVTSLGEYAFSRCNVLSNMTVSGAFPTLGKFVFSNCPELTQVSIPASVTAIGERAFYGCKKLASVGQASGVETVGDCAFMGCSALENVMFSNSLTSIGNSAFSQCESLAAVTLGNSLTSIGTSAFARCFALTSVAIPETVTTIGSSAFTDCRGLTSVTLPAGLDAIKYSTFLRCSALPEITLPASLSNIGYDAFNGCSALTGVAIPAAVTSIADRAFDDCSSLASIQVEAGNTVYDSREDCNALIETGTNVLRLGCKNSVVPATVTRIGDHAFYNCPELTGITLPEGLTTIGNYAFYNCKGLTSITIPSTVDTICSDAFYACTELKTVNSQALVPPVVYSRTFISCYDATLRVPQEAQDDYDAAEFWCQFNRTVPYIGVGPCDVNGDGVVSISDVTDLINLLLTSDEFPAYLDVNGDGVVTISDVTDLINALLTGD